MKKLVLFITITVILSSCTLNDGLTQKAKTGAIIGAVAGSIFGYAVDDSLDGRLIGAAVGALAGSSVGHYMDNQQQEMEASLSAEQARHDIKIQRLYDESLKIDVASKISFDFDSASLKFAFTPTLKKISNILVQYSHTIIHIVGHTDNVGSESYNRELALLRAQSVADYFIVGGILSSRIIVSSLGEIEPRASNQTEAGRQLNRRVEIYVKPIIASG